jgi:hypothetical protein
VAFVFTFRTRKPGPFLMAFEDRMFLRSRALAT